MTLHCEHSAPGNGAASTVSLLYVTGRVHEEVRSVFGPFKGFDTFVQLINQGARSLGRVIQQHLQVYEEQCYSTNACNLMNLN